MSSKVGAGGDHKDPKCWMFDYARPPPGYRTYVRGIPVVWMLKVPLYGEADAGRIWNKTLVKQLVQVQKFSQSQYDPCYFWKHLSDGTRMDVVMYVDDGYAVDAHSAAADAELQQLNEAFTLTLKPAKFFLGNNIVVHDGSQGGAPRGDGLTLDSKFGHR